MAPEVSILSISHGGTGHVVFLHPRVLCPLDKQSTRQPPLNLCPVWSRHSWQLLTPVASLNTAHLLVWIPSSWLLYFTFCFLFSTHNYWCWSDFLHFLFCMCLNSVWTTWLFSYFFFFFYLTTTITTGLSFAFAIHFDFSNNRYQKEAWGWIVKFKKSMKLLGQHIQYSTWSTMILSLEHQ